MPIGFCDRLDIVHSPVRGVHPHLDKGIKIFVKYFGGKKAKKAAKIFKEFGIKTKCYKEARITEAIKIWDTTYYGLQIYFNKFLYEWCKNKRFDFNNIYIEANKTYNAGYAKLNMKQVIRPVLKYIPGKIGGHCIIPNLDFLETNWIKEAIKKYE